MRALLSQAPFETMSAIAAHYLGRPATPPIALSLETAWEVLGIRRRSPRRLEALADRAARARGRRARRRGGRHRGAARARARALAPAHGHGRDALAARRGLLARATRLLIPVHPNRHVVPTEVSAIIGAAHHAEREARREEVRAFVDHGRPRAAARALLRSTRRPPSLDRGGARLGQARVAAGQADLRTGVGTPKSLVQKMATRFGRDPTHVALLFALSRALGLWDASATNVAAPPGSFTLQELTRQLFVTWRRGGAWDEARDRAGGPAPRARGRGTRARRGSCARWSSRRCASSGKVAGCRGLRSRGGCRATTASRARTAVPALGRARRGRARRAHGGRPAHRPRELARARACSTSARTRTCRTTRSSTAREPATIPAHRASPDGARSRAPGRQGARGRGVAVEVPRHARASPRAAGPYGRDPRRGALRRGGPRRRDARPHRRAADARARPLGRPRGRRRCARASRPWPRFPSRCRARSRRRASSWVERRGSPRAASSGSRTATCARCSARGADAGAVRRPVAAGGLLVRRGSTWIGSRAGAARSASRS